MACKVSIPLLQEGLGEVFKSQNCTVSCKHDNVFLSFINPTLSVLRFPIDQILFLQVFFYILYLLPCQLEILELEDR